MRRVRDCIRLKNAGVSTQEIARRVGVAPSTVRLTLQRCEAAGLTWSLDAGLTDTVLEQRLFTNCGTKQGHRRHEEPDWAAFHREMKRKHVTLSILWDEYIQQHPGGYCLAVEAAMATAAAEHRHKVQAADIKVSVSNEIEFRPWRRIDKRLLN